MTSYPEPRHATVTANALRLHYCEWGDPAASPVVLLHGITGHARTWDHLAGGLAERFRVIALDQRGHGDSDDPADHDYRVGSMVADLAAFADGLGLERFHVCGLSMGGRVAIAYASQHAARLNRLVIVDIGPDIAPAGLARVRGMMAGSPERFASEAEAVAHVRRANPLYVEAELQHRVAHGLRRLADGGFAWKYAKGLRDMMREGRHDVVDLWEPLGRITCPALIVRGTESDILSPEIAKRMLGALPDGHYAEVPGAGHTVPGDQPHAFAQVVRAFLTV
jgi:pimeloyl-ACP methyl ester carboxylesterase